MSMLSLNLQDAAELYGDAKLALERADDAIDAHEYRRMVERWRKAEGDLLSAARAFATSTRKRRRA